jgi:hypothetical protein
VNVNNPILFIEWHYDKPAFSIIENRVEKWPNGCMGFTGKIILRGITENKKISEVMGN